MPSFKDAMLISTRTPVSAILRSSNVYCPFWCSRIVSGFIFMVIFLSLLLVNLWVLQAKARKARLHRGFTSAYTGGIIFWDQLSPSLQVLSKSRRPESVSPPPHSADWHKAQTSDNFGHLPSGHPYPSLLPAVSSSLVLIDFCLLPNFLWDSKGFNVYVPDGVLCSRRPSHVVHHNAKNWNFPPISRDSWPIISSFTLWKNQ